MKPGRRGFAQEQLIEAAARFNTARGRRPRGPRAPRPEQPLEAIEPDTAADAEATPAEDKAPAITPAEAKPTAQAGDDMVASILRDAARRSAIGSQADTLASINDERIIGRGDLQDLSYLEVGIAVARGVARIRVQGASGTGSLVGPRIIMTNHHVIPDLGAAAGAVAQFDLQDDSEGHALPRQDYTLDPAYFWFTDQALDVTLVGIAAKSEAGRPAEAYPWTQLSNADRELEDKDALTIIQHPLGGMKQIAFRNNDVILVQQLPNFVHYTTDTQEGSSGSPCFDDMWRLVALHHAGVPATNTDGAILRRDQQVFKKGVDREDQILWIANEGVRMSAVEVAIRTAKLPSEQAARRDELLGAKPPNPVALARELTARPARGGTNRYRGRTAMAGTGGISITVNIQDDEIRGVHIERGDGAPTDIGPAVIATPVAAGDDGDDEGIVIDADWKAREGYDPDFLGINLSLPKLSKAQRDASLKVPPEYVGAHDDAFVFKYHHYSLAFNKKRRIAWYSAANVDGGRREFKYERGKDKWFYDPRMDDKDAPINQIGEELYIAKDTDRGHLTRYLDVQWGDTLEETKNATNDSFHFSNCALQVSEFNQGKDRWQGIEQFLLEKKARKEQRRMVVFTGPVLKSHDPLYRTKQMTTAVRLPLSFWKLCAIVPEDGRPLAVTAFVLGQPDATDLPDIEETFDVTAVQITVAKLAEITGFTFAKPFVDNDHFAKAGPGTLEAFAVLETEDDIVV